MATNHIHDATTHLGRRQLGDAFEALLDLGDMMHDMVDDVAVVADLPQVNRLFSSIIRSSAYGVYEPVDRVINKLLLLSVRRCDGMGSARGQPGQGGIGWRSSAQSDINEHLEFCRNFLSYIRSHPTGRNSVDRNLESAQQSLQRLCPRINGLSKWAWAEEASPATDLRRNPTRSSTSRAQPETKKRSSPRLRRPKAPLPTPPTQSGDVRFAEPIPTVPLERPWKWGGAALPTPDSRPLSHTLGRSAFEMVDVDLRAETDVTQSPLHPTLVLMQESGAEACDGHPQGPRRDDAKPMGCVTGTVPVGFRLRPEHPVSSRCCVFSETQDFW